MLPSVAGKVQTTELYSVSGALNAREKLEPLSYITSLFAFVPSPTMLMLPSIVAAPLRSVPEVLMTVVPLMTPLFKVPPLRSGVVRVLFVNVSISVLVTTTPVVGKVAFDDVPVPPRVRGSIPVTAAPLLKSTAPNCGVPPPSGTVKLW